MQGLSIVHVVQRYRPAKLTGSERYIDALSIHLALRGHKVTIITSTALSWNAMRNPLRGENAPPHCSVYDPLRICRLKPSYAHGFLFYFFRKKPLASIVPRDFRFYADMMAAGPFLKNKRIGRVLDEVDPDLVHATPAPYGYLIYALKESKKRKIPFIVTPFMHLGTRVYRNPYLLRVFREASAVIAATACEARVLRNVYGVKRTYVVPLGIWTRYWLKIPGLERARNELDLPMDAFVILLPHRAYHKGAKQVLLASALLSKVIRPRPVYVLIYGVYEKPPGFDAWVYTAKRYGVNVIDYGAIDEDKKKILFAASDVVAQPSIVDSYGIVYLEAWAAGKPVIAADTIQMHCVVRDSIDGFLVPFGDVVSLARKLLLLAKNDRIANRMGAEGRRRVLRYHDWEIISRQVEQIYYDIIVS